MKRLKVYIASPYTKGDVAANVRGSMQMWDALFGAGFAPFCPLWSHFQHLLFPRSYVDWMESNDAWIGVCDAVFCLPGGSGGAGREVARAKKLGIPVFTSWDKLVEWRLSQEKEIRFQGILRGTHCPVEDA